MRRSSGRQSDKSSPGNGYPNFGMQRAKSLEDPNDTPKPGNTTGTKVTSPAAAGNNARQDQARASSAVGTLVKGATQVAGATAMDKGLQGQAKPLNALGTLVRGSTQIARAATRGKGRQVGVGGSTPTTTTTTAAAAAAATGSTTTGTTVGATKKM